MEIGRNARLTALAVRILILQNASPRQVLVDFLGGANGNMLRYKELVAEWFAGDAEGLARLNDEHPNLIVE